MDDFRVFDDAAYQGLRQINKALFGDGSNLTPDARRDLANRMFVLLERGEAFDGGLNVPNLDAATDDELRELLPVFGRLYDYCMHSLHARARRLEGRIETALDFEGRAQAAYEALPPKYRW